MKESCFLDGTGNVVESDGGHADIYFTSNIFWEQASSKCTLAKITKNLLKFFCVNIYIINYK